MNKGQREEIPTSPTHRCRRLFLYGLCDLKLIYESISSYHRFKDMKKWYIKRDNAYEIAHVIHNTLLDAHQSSI